MLPQARVDRIVVEELGEELLVYDEESDRAYCLSKIANVVWRHCDGQTAISEIVTETQARLDLPRTANGSVLRILEELLKANLIRGPLPESLNGRSPRNCAAPAVPLTVVPVLEPAASSVVARLPIIALPSELFHVADRPLAAREGPRMGRPPHAGRPPRARLTA